MSEFCCQGRRVAYLDSGKGTPFIFQHGLGNCKEQVYPLLEGLPGYRLIAFDCPSHGRSAPAAGADSFSLYGDVLFALMDHLGIEKAVFGGISMGSALSLHAALRCRARCLALVMIRPAWLNAPMPEERQRVYRAFYPYLSMPDGLKRYQNSQLYQALSACQPSAADSFCPFFAYPHAAETGGKFITIPADAPNLGTDCLKALAGLPTLVMGCDQDYFHPLPVAAAMARCIPGAAFFELTSKQVSVEKYQRELRQRTADFLKLDLANAGGSAL